MWGSEEEVFSSRACFEYGLNKLARRRQFSFDEVYPGRIDVDCRSDASVPFGKSVPEAPSTIVSRCAMQRDVNCYFILKSDFSSEDRFFSEEYRPDLQLFQLLRGQSVLAKEQHSQRCAIIVISGMTQVPVWIDVRPAYLNFSRKAFH